MIHILTAWKDTKKGGESKSRLFFIAMFRFPVSNRIILCYHILMKKVKTSAQLKKDLWKIFSKYIRLRDKGICFICGRKCEGSGYHASHFVPKSVGGIGLYFDEDNVHGCCYNCNINLGGNYYLYGEKLGRELAESLYARRGNITKDFPFQERIDHYKSLVLE